jgi:ribosomal protein S6--L-glutamate ligase
MRIALVGSATSWYFRDLQRVAAGRCRLSAVPFSRLAARVGPAGQQTFAAETSLHDFDAVLVRSMPPGSLEQVVFRMDALARLEAGGTPVVNPARSLEVAVDKYLALTRLQAAGLRVPETICCQTWEQGLAAFDQLGGDVVVKPLFGSEGQGITRLTDPALARRAFQMLTRLGAVIYAQPFIPHGGWDLRLLVIGKAVFGMRRVNALDWRTNVSRGAGTEPLRVTDELAEQAQRAAAAVQAPLCALDLLPGKDGRCYALEVNAVPGWRALARTLKTDLSGKVLAFVQSVAAGDVER